MPRTWKALSQDDTHDALAGELLGREQEIHAYETNVAKYEAMIREIADDWPVELLEYRGKPAQALAVMLDDATFARVSRLQFKDELQARLRTERAELAKSEMVLKSLTGMLPEDALLKTALGRVRARR